MKPERVHIRSSSDVNNADSENQPLELVQVIPMILALGIGLCLAIVTFVCELSLMSIARNTFLVGHI